MAADPSKLLGRGITGSVQVGYLTNDTKAAISQFENRFGIGPWVTREATVELINRQPDAAPGCILLVSFAYMKGRMIELIEPLADAPPIFPALPPDGLMIVPHHLGAYMGEVDEVLAAAKSAGFETVSLRIPRGDIVFVDTRALLGHWLELLCFENQNPI